MQERDVIVIGAGLSGLTCAALLAKKGLKVTVIEAGFKPGGSCGIFKRKGMTFEQGAAMLYGFSAEGFNPHYYVFNVLQEPIDMIKHESLYAVNFGQERVVFYKSIDRFMQELSRVFPSEEKGIEAFYKDMGHLYQKVIAETPLFVSPDVVSKEQGLKQFLNHPWSYIKFLSYLNKSAKALLQKYFKNEEIFQFFDKMTSTYCYATVEEAPAVLGAVMFVDNHVGGSYYPAGSTLHLIGKLEKVIEQHQGEMIYNKRASRILTQDGRCAGVELMDGSCLKSEQVVYGGNIWALYESLLKDACSEKTKLWAKHLEPTYPSVVLFAIVDQEVIPQDTLPIEMFIAEKEQIAESEITAYILSIDDHTLCPTDYHVVMTIGPSFRQWPNGLQEGYKTDEYRIQKEKEEERLLAVLEKRFPGFREHIIYTELATPATLERYVLKYKGAVAGPKQKLGQHMLKRQHIATEIEGVFCCGEGTVMGTGTPAVTVSGIAAANLVLRKRGLKEYDNHDSKERYVSLITPPFDAHMQKISTNREEDLLAKLALKCQFCEKPYCQLACPIHVPIRDIQRRVAVGNFFGARQVMTCSKPCLTCTQHLCEQACIMNQTGEPVAIHTILTGLDK
ncbi:MAG: FAD-dependent oxidoreductase [Cellulosilyticaceae bacterium]